MNLNRIEITEEALTWDVEHGARGFLWMLTDKYRDVIGGVVNVDTMPLLNGNQHALLSYRIFCEEVEEGGFIQLIQNGYGPYIFDNPFAKVMRMMGAKEFSKLINKARKIYRQNREYLEKERTDEDFMALYVEYETLNELGDDFLDMELDITEVLGQYVNEHIEDFVSVKNEPIRY